MPEPTNQQLLQAINKLDSKIDGEFEKIDGGFKKIDGEFATVKTMLKAVSDTVEVIVDNYVTHDDLNELETRLSKKIDKQSFKIVTA